MANHVLARQLSTSLPTVLLWRRRFQQQGLIGILEDRLRSGRPKESTPDQEPALIHKTPHGRPKDATHWSVRPMARERGLSTATVQRIWSKHHLQPHRVESFRFSTDPEFAAKVRDIVGLYLDPPDKAIVLSVDEKSQIQTLDRTHPILPFRPGLPERQTDDEERHGTTTLLAVLDVAAGKVIGQCQRRHRHQEFLRFLDKIDAPIPSSSRVHLILDNYGAHKHPDVKKGRRASASPNPFRADQRFVAESGRALVRRDPAQALATRDLSVGSRIGERNSRFYPHPQQSPTTIRLGRKRKQDHRQGPKV